MAKESTAWQNCGIPDYILDGVHPDHDGGFPDVEDTTVEDDNASIAIPLFVEKKVIEHVKVTKVKRNESKENDKRMKVSSIKDFLLCYANHHISLTFIVSLSLFSFLFSNFISLLISTFILVSLVVIDIHYAIGIGVMF